MENKNEPLVIFENGIILKYQKPAFHKQPLTPILFLHGWTGNEHSMWIFTRGFADHLLLAPRGFEKAEPDGFGWVPLPENGSLNFLMYEAAALQLLEHLQAWQNLLDQSLDKLTIVGFSQGAALAIVLAAIAPHRVNRLAVLAGFLPAQPPGDVNFQKLPCFVAHGTQDSLVPISKAVDAAKWLSRSNADVQFCQADVGHKVSHNCMAQLESFLKSA